MAFESDLVHSLFQNVSGFKKHITLAPFFFPCKVPTGRCFFPGLFQVFFGDSSHAATAKGAGALAGRDDFARGCSSNGCPLACEGAATTA